MDHDALQSAYDQYSFEDALSQLYLGLNFLPFILAHPVKSFFSRVSAKLWDLIWQVYPGIIVRLAVLMVLINLFHSDWAFCASTPGWWMSNKFFLNASSISPGTLIVILFDSLCKFKKQLKPPYRSSNIDSCLPDSPVQFLCFRRLNRSSPICDKTFESEVVSFGTDHFEKLCSLIDVLKTTAPG